jgi:hypothetical protein
MGTSAVSRQQQQQQQQLAHDNGFGMSHAGV